MFARNFTAAILAAALTTAAAAQDRSDWPKEMTIGTASQGGPISTTDIV